VNLKPINLTFEGAERVGYERHVTENSFYTRASLHPLITGSALALGVVGLIYAL